MTTLSPSLPALVEALPAAPETHPAATNLASGSASLAPLAQGAVCDSPQAGGVGGGPERDDASPQGAFTRERQVEFLHALAATGAVRAAAARAGVSHQTAYRARLADAVFRRAWDAALVVARSHAEEVLAVRAIDGVEEAVMYHGEVVATRRRYDSRLLLAHLARLDKLTADAKVEAFAGDFEAAMRRFGRGWRAPEVGPPKKFA